MRINPRVMIGVVILLITLGSYYAKREVNPTTGEVQHISLTTDQEIALGLNSAPAMAEQMGGVDPDPAAQELVQSIGGKIVASSEAAKTPYKFQFHVLRDPNTINAFALPGGPVFITRGLLGRLQNEAQLAGVLGHETGHVIARHAAEHMAKGQLAQGVVGAVGVATSDRGAQGAMLAAFVAQMTQLKYGRNDELEADKLGVQFMAEAGYDPRAMLGVMKILDSASSSRARQPEFMSTHPNPGNRTQHIEQEISARWPNGVPAGVSMGRPLSRMPANQQ